MSITPIYPLSSGALILALLLGGCQFNLLKPPQTASVPAGDCVAACETLKNQCSERQRLREQLCQEQQGRLKDPKRSCQPGADPLCPQPIACLGEDLTPCQVQYTECVARCALAPPSKPNKQIDGLGLSDHRRSVRMGLAGWP